MALVAFRTILSRRPLTLIAPTIIREPTNMTGSLSVSSSLDLRLAPLAIGVDLTLTSSSQLHLPYQVTEYNQADPVSLAVCGHATLAGDLVIHLSEGTALFGVTHHSVVRLTQVPNQK